MSNPALDLPGFDDRVYWSYIKAWAKHNSDGCTNALEFYVRACWEHDYHCVHHKTWGGEHLSSAQAAARFRQVLQWESKFGRLSPVAWWRWAAVRKFGPQWD